MKHRGIWLTAPVLAAIVLLAQVAGASTRDETASPASNASVSAEHSGMTPTVALPEQASSIASEASATGIATANQSIADRGRGATTTQATTTNAVTANAPAAAPIDATSGARPGWGCGDTNHTHSGPPGRPGATPPPGCATP